jgi:hypothetical protein
MLTKTRCVAPMLTWLQFLLVTTLKIPCFITSRQRRGNGCHATRNTSGNFERVRGDVHSTLCRHALNLMEDIFSASCNDIRAGGVFIRPTLQGCNYKRGFYGPIFIWTLCVLFARRLDTSYLKVAFWDLYKEMFPLSYILSQALLSMSVFFGLNVMVEGLTLLPRIRNAWVYISARRPAILTEDFVVFLSARIIP